jgi:hypothetical protein
MYFIQIVKPLPYFQVTTWVALVLVKRRRKHNRFSQKKQLAPVEALPREQSPSKGWSFCGNLRYEIFYHLVNRLYLMMKIAAAGSFFLHFNLI